MRAHLSVCAALAGITVAFAAPTRSTQAQNFAGCSRLIAPNGSVTWICPPATVVGGRWRGTQYIPACPAGMAYSRDTNRCLPRTERRRRHTLQRGRSNVHTRPRLGPKLPINLAEINGERAYDAAVYAKIIAFPAVARHAPPCSKSAHGSRLQQIPFALSGAAWTRCRKRTPETPAGPVTPSWVETAQRVAVYPTERDIEIFKLLARFHYLPSDYIHAFVGGNQKALLHRLNLLSRKPNLYLARPPQQRQCADANYRPLTYALDERGARALRERDLPVPLKSSRHNFIHELMIAQITASIELGTRANPARPPHHLARHSR